MYSSDFLYRHKEDNFNYLTYIEFIEDILKHYYQTGHRIYLIQDNASYHKKPETYDWFKTNRKYIEVFNLPPYCPEFNSTEGRIRWKIENEGFNMQKNVDYALEHGYTQNPNAAKVFYFLLQIAHRLIQLMSKGRLLKKAFPSGFGSVKNLSFRILEAWRNARLTNFDFGAILYTHFQIRFDLDSS